MNAFFARNMQWNTIFLILNYKKRWSLLHPNTAQSYPKKTLRKNVKKSARKYRQTKCVPPYRWKGLLLRIDSKWEGSAFELTLSGKLVVNSKRRIKAWSEATEAIYRVGFGNEGSSLIPNSRSFFHENPASRTYFIAIPNIIFYLNPHPCPNLGETGFPGSSQVGVLRERLPESRNVFCHIPEPGSTLSDPEWGIQFNLSMLVDWGGQRQEDAKISLHFVEIPAIARDDPKLTHYISLHTSNSLHYCGTVYYIVHEALTFGSGWRNSKVWTVKKL